MSQLLKIMDIDFRDKQGRFLKGKQNPFVVNLELGRIWKQEHKITDKEKKERGWYFDGKIKYYWKNCLCCGREYQGQGAYFCSYTCSRLYAEAKKADREVRELSEIEGNYYQRTRTCGKYIKWRNKILERDNYTCILCGETKGQLDVDHFSKSFIQILEENNINSLEDSLLCEELWDINNGRTLCIECHKKTDTYCKRKKII